MEQARFDACMQRISNGDKSALKEIYESYMKYVFLVIYQVVGNHEDAEDRASLKVLVRCLFKDLQMIFCIGIME